MNTGIQDAYNLSWKLAAVLVGAPDPLLDTYQAERLPVARSVLAATSAQHRALFDTNGAEALSRQFTEATNTTTGADFTGLSVNYHGSPLSHDVDRNTGIRAGDRAPDAPCRTADGKHIRLFDLFRGPHFTLLAFGASPAPRFPNVRVVRLDDAANSDIQDTEGHARHAYGITGNATVLIRPDGYVALTGSTVGSHHIASYLEEDTNQPHRTGRIGQV